jgi:diguanylate cyclase (GGDEF)-like protein
MPRVFASILETGEALVFPDLTTAPSPDVSSAWADGVRGFVAVPIVGADEQIVGTICVFDLKPLAVGGSEVAALKALGRRASARPDSTPVHPQSGARPRRAPAAVAADATGLLDRRSGHLAIARELLRMRREEQQLSVVLFDVDSVQRTDQGDAMGAAPDPFVAVCETLTRAIRGSDLAIRWSREELLLVLPGLSVTEARPVAERVRAALQAGARHNVAVSGGLAELRADDTFESVVARANDKVRLARERGHNHVA